MVQHVDKHTNALRRIQSTGTDVYFDISRSQDRLAPELEEVWQSSLDQFQMGIYVDIPVTLLKTGLSLCFMCYADLQRQKIELSMEIREQLDVEKKKYTTNHEQELQDIVSERK